MQIEKLSAGHLEACAQIYIDTFNAPPWNDKWDNVSAYKRLEEIYRTPGFMGMVVMEESILIGAVLGNVETWYEGYMFNLKEMFIKQGIKGKGIGSYLFKALEKNLQDQGITSLSLFTSRGDMTETFYLKNGCLTDEDMIMMCKDL